MATAPKVTDHSWTFLNLTRHFQSEKRNYLKLGAKWYIIVVHGRTQSSMKNNNERQHTLKVDIRRYQTLNRACKGIKLKLNTTIATTITFYHIFQFHSTILDKTKVINNLRCKTTSLRLICIQFDWDFVFFQFWIQFNVEKRWIIEFQHYN